MLIELVVTAVVATAVEVIGSSDEYVFEEESEVLDVRIDIADAFICTGEDGVLLIPRRLQSFGKP